MHDLVIKEGLVVDGSGAAPYAADVAVDNGRIARIGTVTSPARDVLYADGHVVAPGFIDMHSHAEAAMLTAPTVEAKIRQGVTTEVVGQDGTGIVPVTPQARDLFLASGVSNLSLVDWDWSTLGHLAGKIDRATAVNAVFLVPHASIRASVVGFDDRAPTADELDAMCRMTEECLADGAFGLSAGLTYAPGMYAANDEIVALCGVVTEHGGYYSPHHRSYGVGALDAYAECISVARESGVRLHLTHASLMHEENRRAAPRLLGLVDAAVAEGIDVTMDIYPYAAAEGSLPSMLPGWMHDGGTAATLRRLDDPAVLARLQDVMEKEGSDGFQGAPVPWEKVQIGAVHHAGLSRLVGGTIADAAATLDLTPYQAFIHLLKVDELRTSFVEHTAYEENVQQIMRHPRLVFGSDGSVGPGYVHPRAFGTFPRVLGRYVRELQVLDIADAVRKMTSGPADILGLADRGRLVEGAHADLVCFDPDTVEDHATYETPRQYPTGIRDVLVSGESTVRDGRVTGRMPGTVLRHPVRRK